MVEDLDGVREKGGPNLPLRTSDLPGPAVMEAIKEDGEGDPGEQGILRTREVSMGRL